MLHKDKGLDTNARQATCPVKAKEGGEWWERREGGWWEGGCDERETERQSETATQARTHIRQK